MRRYIPHSSFIGPMERWLVTGFQVVCVISSFSEGALAEVVGLKNREDLNYEIATIIKFNPESNTYLVRIEKLDIVVKVAASCLVEFGSGCEELISTDPRGIPWYGEEKSRHNLPAMLSMRRVREALRRSIRLGMEHHTGVRIISMPDAQQRRGFMKSCVDDLRELGLNCSFEDGVVGRNLPVSEAQLRGDITRIKANGMSFTVDTSAWLQQWSEALLAEVREGFDRMRFFPNYWSSICQNVQDPQTLGFVGGHISHVSVWQQAWKRSWDWVLVLEDDALPVPGLTWQNIWRIVEYEIRHLQQGWDIIYVGRTLSMTPEGERVSGLLCEPGYCLRTHSYCLSRRGYSRLLTSGVASTILHMPQDEVLATLWMGDHVWPLALQKVQAIAPHAWRALAVRWRGLTAQLLDVEKSVRAASQAAVHENSSDGRGRANHCWQSVD